MVGEGAGQFKTFNKFKIERVNIAKEAVENKLKLMGGKFRKKRNFILKIHTQNEKITNAGHNIYGPQLLQQNFRKSRRLHQFYD